MSNCRKAANAPLFVGTAFAVLIATAPANAGLLDPAPAYPTKFVNTTNTLLYDWTGFYFGINGGGSFGHVNWSSDPDLTSGTANVSSGLVGGTIGYNMQNLGPLVVGQEFDFDWRGLTAGIPPASCAPNCELKSNWVSTARIRFGYMLGTFLPYVTGGLSMSDFSQDIVGQPLSVAKSLSFNWTAGAGVEFTISGPFTAKVEYLYVAHTIPDYFTPSGFGPIHMNFGENVFRVGLNYRLSGW
jgi:outer membrane immunogenic protein